MSDRKGEYFDKLRRFLNEYKRIFIVVADNVGSSQMQKIRIALRGKAEVLMGKNTMIRRCIRDMNDENFKRLLPYVRLNIGFVFTNGDLKDIRDTIVSNKVPAPARVGAIAPLDVTVPAGNTGMEPTKTSFFQALGIPTKITKGTVEIISDVLLLKRGDRVDQSQAELLKVMGIKPFSYGLEVCQVYEDGSVYSPEVLDITDDMVSKHFFAGLSTVAAVSLGIGYPTLASLPHSIVGGFRNILAVSISTSLDIPQAKSIKEFLADPSKFAVAAAPAAAAAAPAAAKAAAKEPEKEEEEEEEEMGFGLFD